MRLLGAVLRTASPRDTAYAGIGSAGEAAARLDGSPRRRLYAGRDPARARTIEDLRAIAHRRLPAFALEYLEAGAEDEATLARNRAALAELRLLPRALVDVSARSTEARLLDAPASMPLAVAPTGLNGLFWADADLLLARAAAEAGVPFIQSTMSNVAMERIARVPGLRHWWQLYVFGAAEARRRLVARVEAAGCEALVLTTDAQLFGNREWSEHHFSRPGRLDLRALLDAARHPGWAATTLRRGMPRFENLLDQVPEDRQALFDSAFWVRRHMMVGLDWAELDRIRRQWPRRLLVKGLLRPDDVRRAADAGVDGVVLSNHGGRQLDWTVSGLDSLSQARAAVGRRIALLVDGGIRRGTDVLKALALGADAVLVGRAPLYGVAAAGEAGAARALEILRDELELTLGLLGARSPAELGPGWLCRPSHVPPPFVPPPLVPTHPEESTRCDRS